MPGLNGLELQGRLIAEGYRIPVIFMTAFPEESARSKALKAGALGFLSKPFNEDKLFACLDLALTNGSPTSPKH
jgi:FixJ family two-component response regulator